jgi:hypothetical protein
MNKVFNSTFLASATKSFCWFFFLFVLHVVIFYCAHNQFFGLCKDSQLSLRNLIPETFDYVLKFIVTIPIWYLIFRKFKTNRCILDCAFTFYFATFILVWKAIFFTSFHLDFNHLRGSSQAWDIYIPGLFYCIQFGVLHAYEYYKTNEENKIQSALQKQL